VAGEKAAKDRAAEEGEEDDMHRGPHDLSQIRPSAELDRPLSQTHPSGKKRRRRATGVAKARQRRLGGSWLGRVGVGLAVVVALVAAGTSALFYAISPAELVRTEIIRQVKAQTGRDLVIGGAARVMLYPSIGVSLGDVRLSKPPQMGGGPMLTAERVDLSVALLPLFSREVHVEHVALVAPVLDLTVDAQGRESWSFAGAREPARYAALGSAAAGGRIASDAGSGLVVETGAPAAAVAGLPEAIRAIELRSIAMTRALIRYHDARSGVRHEIGNLNLRLSGRRITDPLRAIGDLVWHGEKIAFDGRLEALSDIIAGETAKARVTLTGAPLSAGFEGTIKAGAAFEARGQTQVDGRSLAKVAAWLGTELPNAAPLGGFRVAGRLVAGGRSLALNEASFALGDARASGIILAELRDTRPFLSTDLKISALDVDKLAAAFAEARPAPPPALPTTGVSHGAATVSANDRAGDPAPPRSIEDLLRRSEVGPQQPGAGKFAPQPQVRGYESRDAWRTETIEASMLGLVDAKARLTIDGLKVAGLAIARTVMRAALSNGALRIDIDDLKGYGGGGKGIVTVHAASGALRLGANLTVEQVAIQPLLKDAAGFEMLAGRGDIHLVLAGAGKSEQTIADSLDGEARLTFRDGAIVGWNLAKILRGLGQGQIGNLDAVSAEKTDFSELAATFKIVDGNAVTDDIRLLSPLLRVTGAGRVGIGARDVDLGLRPKLVSSLAGQGGANDLGGLEVPIRLAGPWRAPRVRPDIGGLTKDPAKLLEAVRGVGRPVNGRSIGDVVRGVLGDTSTDGGQNGSPPTETKGGGPGGGGAQDLIGRFLR
jgi:AsmA protein